MVSKRIGMRMMTLLFALSVVIACSGGGGGGTSGNPDYPSVPTGLTVTAVSPTEISLSWNASTDDVAVAGYLVYRNGALISGMISGTSKSDTGLAVNTNYCYTVAAIDSDNNVSAECSQVCATTPNTAPGGFAIRQQGAQLDLTAVGWNGSEYLVAGQVGLNGHYTFSSSNGVLWTRSATNNLIPYGITDILWDGGKYVVVSDYGDVYTTTNGTSWTMHHSGSPSNALHGLAWSGSLYVATGETGTILTSQDGISWTVQTSPTSTITLNAVTWGGDKFVVVGNEGLILTSSNGATWTSQASNTSVYLKGIAWSGNKFCAVGAITALSSSNGVDWTSSSLPSGLFPERIAWSGTLNLFAVADQTGHILTSPDCVTWTDYPQSSQNLYGISWLHNQFIAVGYPGEIITSTDGVTWTTRMSGAHINGVTWTGSKFIAVGSIAGRSLTSADGITWSYSGTGESDYLYDVAWSSSLGLAVAVGQQTSSSAGIWSSPDGNFWTERVGWVGAASNFYGVTSGNNLFVAVGASSGGIIYTSATGTNWEYQPSGATPYTLKDVAWSGSTFVAVGYHGTILSSATGTNWAAQTSNTTQDLYGVSWTGTQFVAVGISGILLTSPDGATWTPRTSGTTNSLYSAASDGTNLYVAGGGGTIYISTDGGATWSSLSQPTYNSTHGMAWSGSRLVVVGTLGSIVTRY